MAIRKSNPKASFKITETMSRFRALDTIPEVSRKNYMKLISAFPVYLQPYATHRTSRNRVQMMVGSKITPVYNHITEELATTINLETAPLAAFRLNQLINKAKGKVRGRIRKKQSYGRWYITTIRPEFEVNNELLRRSKFLSQLMISVRTDLKLGQKK